MKADLDPDVLKALAESINSVDNAIEKLRRAWGRQRQLLLHLVRELDVTPKRTTRRHT